MAEKEYSTDSYGFVFTCWDGAEVQFHVEMRANQGHMTLLLNPVLYKRLDLNVSKNIALSSVRLASRNAGVLQQWSIPLIESRQRKLAICGHL